MLLCWVSSCWSLLYWVTLCLLLSSYVVIVLITFRSNFVTLSADIVTGVMLSIFTLSVIILNAVKLIVVASFLQKKNFSTVILSELAWKLLVQEMYLWLGWVWCLTSEVRTIKLLISGNDFDQFWIFAPTKHSLPYIDQTYSNETSLCSGECISNQW